MVYYIISRGQTLFRAGAFIAYTASDNALRGRGSGHARLASYYRSETPLIYKAVPNWFVRVESIVDKLLTNYKKCYW